MNTKTLYELCEVLSREIEDQTQKVIKGGMDQGSLEIIDKLTHALKSVKTTLAMEEAQQGGYQAYRAGGGYNASGGYNAHDRYYAYPNSSEYGAGGYGEGGYNEGYGEGGYGRRGRNSMGRYTAEGANLGEELQKLIQKAPTPQIRMDMEHLMQKINNAQ